METTASALVAAVLLLVSAVHVSAAPFPSTTHAPSAAPSTTDTTTTTTITTTTATSAPTAASGPAVSAGPEFCSVSRLVRLAAGSAEASSLRLRLAEPSRPRPEPCRLRLSAPASNTLRLEMTLSAEDADAALGAYDEDDVLDGGRVRGLAEMFMGAHAAPEAAENESMDLLRDDLVAGESCPLTMVVDGLVWRSVDLCDADAVRGATVVDGIPHNVTLEWVPPQDGRSLRVAALNVSTVRRAYPAANLCSVRTRTVQLAGQGTESVLALELHDSRQPEDRLGPCEVTVVAPAAYKMSVLFVRNAVAAASSESASVSRSSESSESNVDSATSSSGETATANGVDALAEGGGEDDADATKPSCRLSVQHGCGDELLSVDLCDPASASTLNFTDVTPGKISLVWSPPPPSQRGHQLSSTLILTAVGVGHICSGSQFAQCYSRPRSPALCVPAAAACDGYYNCPSPSGGDESADFCRPKASFMDSSAQRGAAANTKSAPADAKESILELLINHYRQQQNSASSRAHDTSPQNEPSPDTLSNYGPWGYLMLGMLVCGAFLMLCGLWECCCRQPKATPAAPSHAPTTVLMPQLGATGGILVLDSDLEDDPSRPPPYEELDQPPSYGVLFPPGQPKDDAPALVVAVLTALPPASPEPAEDAAFADAEDVPSLPSASPISSMESAVSRDPS